MTELQKCEFFLLKEALKIIEQERLTYYLVCGTALGAVKYDGFIPWDDDIDIALPREDYERFLNIALKSLPKEIELQNHRYDSCVPFFYTKLRLSNTTFIEKTVEEFDINHGVFIDVFPLDGLPHGKSRALIFEIKKRIVWRLISTVFKRDNRWKNIVIAPFRIIVRRKLNFLVRKYESLISKVSITDSQYICNFGNSPSRTEYSPKSHYGKGVLAQFEGLEVIVPSGYDEYLTLKYGCWREDLPEDERKGHHYVSVIDLERPYTYYKS